LTDSLPTFDLSVVIPVYNGARTIGRVVDALCGLPIAQAGGMEIVLVYDGSPDDSLAACHAAASKATSSVQVIEHSRNFGEHQAVMTGLRHARGQLIINIDDDLQNPPMEVQRLYDHARQTGADVVYTWYEAKKHAWWRNLGSQAQNWLADQLLDKPKGLYLSSFRCMNAFVAREITRYQGPYPFIDGLIMQVTQRIERLQVAHSPRMEGESNYTFKKLMRVVLAMALNFSILPLRIATFFGLLMSVLGFLGALFVLVEALFGVTPQGWASTLVVILLLAGAQLVMLGIAGEYLGRVFLTLNGAPQGIVRNATVTVQLTRENNASEQIISPELPAKP
jgi:glycosyltransferase involved in cell wall biosynthesis